MRKIVVVFLACVSLFSWSQQQEGIVSGIIDGVYLVEKPYEEWKVFDSLVENGQPNAAKITLDKILQKAIHDQAEYNTIRAVQSYTPLLRYLETNERGELFYQLYALSAKMEAPTQALTRIILLNDLLYDEWKWFSRNQDVLENELGVNLLDEQERIPFIFNQLEQLCEELDKFNTNGFKPYQELLLPISTDLPPSFSVMDYLGIELVKLYSNYSIQAHIRKTAEGETRVDPSSYLLYPEKFAQLSFNLSSPNEYPLSIFQLLEKTHQNNNALFSEVYYERLLFALKHNPSVDRKKVWKEAADFIGQNEHRSRFIYEYCHILYQEGIQFDFKTNTNVEDYLSKAHNILEKELSLFPNAKAADVMQTLLELIEAPQVHLIAQNYVYPKDAIPLKLTHKNTSQLRLQVYTHPEDKTGKLTFQDYLSAGLSELVQEKNLTVTDKEDYNFRSTGLLLDGIKSPGDYFILITPQNSSLENSVLSDSLWKLLPRTIHAFKVTEIFAATRSTNEGFEVIVTDYKTGEPIKNARVNIYPDRNLDVFKQVPSRTGTTNKDGIYKVGLDRWFNYEITYKGSTLRNSGSHYKTGKEKKVSHLKVLTDRGIYRPGQTVYFKGIAYEGKDNNYAVLPNETLTLTVKDASWQEVYTTQLTTNEFGSVDGSFVLPLGGPLGNFRLLLSYKNGKNNQQSTSTFIKVEEYKRPTFEVALNQPKTAAQLNDSVTFTGYAKAFAGYAISGAKVELNVYRSWSTYWRYGGSTNRDLMLSIDTLTDELGNFSATFYAPEATEAPEYAYYTFNIEAKITDLSGETHSKTLVVPLNKTGLTLAYEGPTSIRTLNEEYITYSIKNLFGVEQPDQEMTLTIYEKEYTPTFEAPTWQQAEFVLYNEKDWKKLFPYEQTEGKNYTKNKLKTLTITSSDSLLLNDLVNNKQGSYIFEAFTITPKQDTLLNSTTLEAIDVAARIIPTPQPLWTYLSHNTLEVGESVDFQVGTSYAKGQALVRLENSQGVISEKWLDLKERQKWCYTIQEADRGNIAFSVLLIQNGKRYTATETVTVPFTNKKLHIKQEVFRDQLLSGSEEKWKFTISGEQAEKIGGELCMGMYDASLDQFVTHNWNLWPYRNSYFYMNWNGPQERSNRYQNGNGGWWDNAYSWEADDRMFKNTRLYNIRIQTYSGYGYGSDYRTKQEDLPLLNMYSEDDISYDLEEVAVMTVERKDGKKYNTVSSPNFEEESVPEEDKNEEETINQTSPTDLQIRENFNETAFFYPNLRVNSAGEYVVEFTVPESLTQWRIMGLAHTKEVEIGKIELDARAKKELMVTANAPRFFRQGDVFQFSSKVVNTTTNDQTVTVELSFFDPVTNQPIVLTGNQPLEKTVEINAEGATEVIWELEIGIETGVIAYQVKAYNSNFGDGEQKTIPVLSNRQLVTEVMPFVLTKKGTKNLTFPALKNNTSTSLTHSSLTFEYTSNIAWNAVLALPYLAEYPYECSEQLFSRYFANALASKVIENHPEIQRVFENWQSENPSTFESQLSKNQELKTILLEETPWVLDAQNEQEQNARLAQLFELNQLSKSQKTSLAKLKQNQNSDGSFGWFGKRYPNIYITQHLVAGFGQLKALGVDLPEEAIILTDKAISFLNSHYIERFNKMINDSIRPKTIGNLEIMWLFASSYFTQTKNDAVLHVQHYYDSLLKRQWTSLSLQEQAMAGLYFKNTQQDVFVNKLSASFQDRARTAPSKGLYFPENKGGRYWNERIIETHGLITAFLAAAEAPTEVIDGLRLWLFLNKERTAWESTKATTTAVYALLSYGTNYLSSTDLPSIKIGEEKLVYRPSDQKNERYVDPTAGLGYLKTTWTKNEVSAKQAEISIVKSDSAPSVGALYWSYFEDMDKIEASQQYELQLTKTYHRVVAGPNGDELIADSVFQRGDRIRVTLTVSSQQELEFVHLKDLRPAGFEPILNLSQHQWEQGIGYYQSPRDVSMNYFIDYLPKGRFTFSYDVYVTNSGEFQTGSASIQCMYAPEFIGNSGGIRMKCE